MPAIGIDLGTTFSRVAVFRNGIAEVIINDEGKRSTPSFVAFSNTERIVGEEATNHYFVNRNNIIFDMKRLIGRKLGDATVQMDIEKWPFDVFSENGDLKISILGERTYFTPEEVTASILMKMKENAEKYLGETVQDAVITVPANFNNVQREAMKNSAIIAGLKVLRIMNEPTSAALAFSINSHLENEKNILIFDIGGGTFDVSILTMSPTVLKVKSTVGDTHLGGEDFDDRLIEHFVMEFKNEHQIDLMENPRALRRLQKAAERIKRILSSNVETTIRIDALCDGIDLCKRISRARFEDLCLDLFHSTLNLVEKALNDANMNKSEIDDILLVGGSTKIPKIQSLLRDFFNGKQLKAIIHPEEAVVCGAAIQASILSGIYVGDLGNICLLDVTPLSLGIESAGGVMTKIIERNSCYPCKKTKTFTTFDDHQTGITVEIFEGERILTKDNNILGKFELSGIPSTSRGFLKIDVTLELDANGILNAKAKENKSGCENNIVIENGRNRFSREEVDQMLLDVERYKYEDGRQRNRIVARNNLKCHIFYVKRAAEQNVRRLSSLDKELVLKVCANAVNWIEINQMANKEELEEKIDDVTRSCQRIMRKLKLEPIMEEDE